jgi:hypothetical protein
MSPHENVQKRAKEEFMPDIPFLVSSRTASYTLLDWF